MAYTYLSPFSGFNAWANYNTPEENKGFNYTMDPFYNVAGDQQRWDLAQTGANSETNRARVWRWTLDNLRAQGLDPGKAPQATVNQYYLNNIGRLRQDYQANGFDWNRSGFSGYDKFLQTDPSKMPGGPRPTDPAGNPIDPSTIGNKGPNTSPPVKNPGLPTPNPGVNGGYNAALADQLNSNPDYAFRYMLSANWASTPTPLALRGLHEEAFPAHCLSADLAARRIERTGGPGGAQAMQTIANDVASIWRRLFQRAAATSSGSSATWPTMPWATRMPWTSSEMAFSEQSPWNST
jgi:hypothetical protein